MHKEVARMEFEKNRKPDVEETVIKNSRGDDVHILDGEDGLVEVVKCHMEDFLPTGEEWCPHCHVKCIHHDKDEYFECPECGWTTCDWEIEEFGGHPTEASSYEDDFGPSYEEAYSDD